MTERQVRKEGQPRRLPGLQSAPHGGKSLSWETPSQEFGNFPVVREAGKDG